MSLVDVSHPRATGSDELVPSRYAVRVGDVEVINASFDAALDRLTRPFMTASISCSSMGTRPGAIIVRC